MVIEDQLADGDVTKYPFIEEMSSIKIMNLLTFRIIKADIEKRQAEIQRLKHRL